MSNGEEEIVYEKDSIEQMLVDGVGVLLIKGVHRNLGIINMFTDFSAGVDVHYGVDHLAVESLADVIRTSSDPLFREKYLLVYCRPLNE